MSLNINQLCFVIYCSFSWVWAIETHTALLEDWQMRTNTVCLFTCSKHRYILHHTTTLLTNLHHVLSFDGGGGNYPCTFLFPSLLQYLAFPLYIFQTWALELVCDISKASCPHVDFADFPLKSICRSPPRQLLKERQSEMRNKPQTCSSVQKKIPLNVTLRSVLRITHPQSINNWLADTLQLSLQLGITGQYRQITQAQH